MPDQHLASVTPSNNKHKQNHSQDGLPLSVRRIIAECARKHNTSERRILSRSCYKVDRMARVEAQIRCRDEIVIQGAPASFPRIGLWFGRDHSAIVINYRKHGKKIQCS